MKKNLSFILMFILTFFIFNSNVLAIEVISNCADIPSKVGTISRLVFTIIKYAVPILLVIIGSIDYLKAVTSGDQDMLSKALKSFTKRLIAGALVFLIIILFQTVIRLVSNEENIFSCVTCFLTSEESCLYKEIEDKDDEDQDVTTGVKDNRDDFDEPGSGGSSGSSESPEPGSGGSSGSSESPNTKKTGNIFIGDSRFVGMKDQIGISANEKYIAKSSQGLKWFNDTAYPELNSYLNSNPGTYNIIINLGVNDLYNIQSYINRYAELAQSILKKHSIIIVSVNPINDKVAAKVGSTATRNSNVIDFNNKMKSISNKSSNIKYCDTYSNIINDFKTGDGLHYYKETNQKIHDYIVNKCL